MQYSRTLVKIEEFEYLLSGKLNGFQINRIADAYQFADQLYDTSKINEEIHTFFHTTRVCKILINEAGVYDPDLLIASLLHHILDSSDQIAMEVIEYNFESNVKQILNNLSAFRSIALIDNNEVDLYKYIKKDYLEEVLILYLAGTLDHFRCMNYDAELKNLKYASDFFRKAYKKIKRFVKTDKAKFLINEIKEENNKILD